MTLFREKRSAFFPANNRGDRLLPSEHAQFFRRPKFRLSIELDQVVTCQLWNIAGAACEPSLIHPRDFTGTSINGEQIAYSLGRRRSPAAREFFNPCRHRWTSRQSARERCQARVTFAIREEFAPVKPGNQNVERSHNREHRNAARRFHKLDEPWRKWAQIRLNRPPFIPVLATPAQKINVDDQPWRQRFCECFQIARQHLPPSEPVANAQPRARFGKPSGEQIPDECRLPRARHACHDHQTFRFQFIPHLARMIYGGEWAHANLSNSICKFGGEPLLSALSK